MSEREGRALKLAGRTFGIGFGIATHALFALTVWRLFPFLLGETRVGEGASAAGGLGWLAFDLLLAVQFGPPHSLLLAPKTRARLAPLVPSAFYGCFFCACTCLGLLLTMTLWQPSGVVLWQLHGTAAGAMTALYVGSWVALLYSLQLNGLGYQTGWTPWWAWVRKRPAPPRRFEPRGAYHVLRHPVYMSLLGMLWLAPVLTLDRLLLNAVWTGYIFVGSALKDRRLASAIGEAYHEYQARVPGYPFFIAGPLGKVTRVDAPGGAMEGLVQREEAEEPHAEEEASAQA